MKRFWDQASLTPTDTGHQLLLDGKPMRLPDGGTLTIAFPTLAAAIRDEWQNAGGAKGQEFHHATHLPLTQLHTTATHRIAPDRAAIISAIAAYGETDLLCYRAASPAILRERQDHAWQPWLDWAALRLDAPLAVTEGIAHIAQPPASLHALTAAVGALSDYELAALGVVVPATGSLILGLALIKGAMTAVEANLAASIDEQYQTEFWGADDEATNRADHVATEIALAARFLELVKT